MAERIQNVHEKWYKGVKYKSTLEADTAEALDKMGLPIRYEERVLTVFEGFRCSYQKEKVRDITYKPDFWVGDIILECKGFETPEWKLKKKLVFKYLKENEPNIIFYQIHDARKQLIQALDPHWNYLGYAIRVTSNKKNSNGQAFTHLYDSVSMAMVNLGLEKKSIGPIVRSLMGIQEYVFGYNWKLKKLRYE
jgi:hypothetical protein